MPTFSPTMQLLWCAASSLQYGYHISALNSSQDSLRCADHRPWLGLWGMPACVDMSQSAFGLVTASYTLGGLVSSLNASRLVDGLGRRKTAVVAAWLIVAGGFLMAIGSSVTVLVLGRMIIGLSCGISTVLVPLYISEIAPNRGGTGILTQLSICAGIFLAQAISIPLSEPRTGKWRLIGLASVAIAVAQVGEVAQPLCGDRTALTNRICCQIATSSMMVETAPNRQTPIYDIVDDHEREPISLEGPSRACPTSTGHNATDESLTLVEVYRSKDAAIKSSFWTLVLSQLFQQTRILTAVSPTNAKGVALFVTIVNFAMTLPAVYLIDRLGRRALLLISLSSMAVSTAVLAFAINHSLFALASLCIVLFVATFSIGLGPIPFVLMGELPPPEGTNWGLNFIIGSLVWRTDFRFGNNFLPDSFADLVRRARFAVISAVGYFVMARRLRATTASAVTAV
ncbi:BQ2448_6685 [Microbotryum intermedium]|uniref:BQ2448_6685 protein n=1 Tax=Microbotryum intermedium TaxID=269621 RepID=A0A238FQH8_9BASI|nr:BQ2448_6685 [Microbotryum intermedium]